MIAFTLIKTKILEYCIESLFSKIEKSILSKRILFPGLRVQKIINLAKKADYKVTRENGIKVYAQVVFDNCVILKIEESRFMGEIFRMISFYEQGDPGRIHSELEPDLEIIY